MPRLCVPRKAEPVVDVGAEEVKTGFDADEPQAYRAIQKEEGEKDRGRTRQVSMPHHQVADPMNDSALGSRPPGSGRRRRGAFHVPGHGRHPCVHRRHEHGVRRRDSNSRISIKELEPSSCCLRETRSASAGERAQVCLRRVRPAN